MYCNQCEQTFQGTACVKMGVCGKQEAVSDIQDVINYALRGLALAALEAGKKEIREAAIGRLCVQGLFSTVTNVNFDEEPLIRLLFKIVETKDALVEQAGLKPTEGPLAFKPLSNIKDLLGNTAPYSILTLGEDPDIRALRQTILFGLKGVAAYTDHAAVLGVEDLAHYDHIYRLLAAGYDGRARTLEDWVGEALDVGACNMRAMELLDQANTQAYGHPEPTKVSLDPKPGKCICITGHDLKDLHFLLEETKDMGINIYTHGEMLPAHAYPELKKYPHLAGHFGTAWQNQHNEFPHFPGAILFTTNCIQRPSDEYRDNVFTTGLVGWPGVSHVKNGDFGPVIARAMALPGYTQEDVVKGSGKSVMVGFGHKTVMSVAEDVVEAVKSGAIRHFYLVGGCDGARPGRNYYTEFVEKTPADSIVLTLACGKFRFFDKELGTIGGLPRLMDVGQCNDAYSAIKIAEALAAAFRCTVNDLPLTLILSWYEQKAVAILLTLLHLGIKNIHLGPTLPAFLTPAVIGVLADAYGIKPISTVDADLGATLAGEQKSS